MSIPSYLVVAYLVFWLLPFVLALSIWLRQRRLEREIDDVMRVLGEDRRPVGAVRHGWDEAFRAMNERGDDVLLDG